ncbi:MAG: N-acetyltransferase [Ignavibacteria bacterium]|nr:N-acetyltransferase [Ignavibacteria bacterium]MBT8382707.1 N-acetyltransferase [Ignavibacteria bacterium]MBT8391435.1 N-acetyltransferase [Ignavibacteria bacterium]NNJ53700.1 N-acetyltransferase [Ignavibacteriaceae bacterium]NNL21205.1 N-acetyltransferase [Ignavibacteriaceae bacterium]
MEQKVKKEEKRFVIYTKEKEVYVEFQMRDETMDLDHTYTHPELRGKGLAALVVRAALEYAKENKFKVIPTCSYVRSFINKNEEYKTMVV